MQFAIIAEKNSLQLSHFDLQFKNEKKIIARMV